MSLIIKFKCDFCFEECEWKETENISNRDPDFMFARIRYEGFNKNRNEELTYEKDSERMICANCLGKIERKRMESC